MLNSHKNALLKTIEESGFERTQFSIEDRMLHQEGGQRNVVVIQFKDSNLFFSVRVSTRSHDLFDCCFSLFAPSHPLSAWYPVKTLADINGIQYKLSEWLANTVGRYLEEFDVPDFWSEVGSRLYDVLPDSDAPGADDQFTEREKKFLKKATEQIREQLREALKPTEDQLRAINERLDYMCGAIDRLNKTDWKSIVVSTIFGIITTMSVDKATGSLVYEIFKNVLSRGVGLLK
jgi:hypothetical protein